MDKTTLCDQEKKLSTFLFETFHKHGVECEIKDSLLLFPRQRMTAYVRLFDQTSGPTVIVQLDVILEIGLGKEIVESCAGIGNTIESATDDAWSAFLRNSFHVLLSAFFTKEYDDQIHQYEWNISGRTYKVVMSQISIRGNQPKKFTTEWLDQFEEMVKSQQLSPGTHWIRLYYAQSGWETLNSEILLDNEIWSTVASRVESFKYPKIENFFSLRIFVVLKDKLDISRAAATMAWLHDEGDEIIDNELIKDGISLPDTEKIRTFIPLAFGRVFLKGLTSSVFPDQATIIDGADNKTRIDLQNEPIYTEAYKLAEKIMKTGSINKEHFQFLFAQSAELNAYNNALLEGAKPEDLDGGNFGEPVIFLPHYQSGDNSTNMESEIKTKKPWKFWKNNNK